MENRVHYLSRSFWGGMVMGMLAFGALGAFGIWFTVQIPVAIYPPPITYIDPTFVSATELCPGDTLAVKATVQFGTATMVQTFVTLRNVATGRNVPNTQLTLPVRMQPHAVSFEDAYAYTIPLDLPPGKYEYMRGTIATNMDTEPAFMVMPFEVREDCP